MHRACRREALALQRAKRQTSVGASPLTRFVTQSGRAACRDDTLDRWRRAPTLNGGSLRFSGCFRPPRAPVCTRPACARLPPMGDGRRRKPLRNPLRLRTRLRYSQCRSGKTAGRPAKSTWRGPTTLGSSCSISEKTGLRTSSRSAQARTNQSFRSRIARPTWPWPGGSTRTTTTARGRRRTATSSSTASRPPSRSCGRASATR